MREKLVGQLIKEHSQGAFALAVRMLRCREDALDVIQDACYSLLKQSSLPGESKQFRMLLYKVVRNKAIDRIRSNRIRLSEEYSESLAEDHTDPALLMQAKQSKQSLDLALVQLSPEHRDIILLKDWQGFSYAEISEILEIESGTVMSRLHRARMTMRNILKQGEIE